MFGIGMSEMLLIFVIALIVLGPKKLPEVARTLGKALGEFRKVSTEFQRTINTEVAIEEHDKQKKEAEKELFAEDGTKKPAPEQTPEQTTVAATKEPVTLSVDQPLEDAADNQEVIVSTEKTSENIASEVATVATIDTETPATPETVTSAETEKAPEQSEVSEKSEKLS